VDGWEGKLQVRQVETANFECFPPLPLFETFGLIGRGIREVGSNRENRREKFRERERRKGLASLCSNSHSFNT